MDIQSILGFSEKHIKEIRSCGYLYFQQGAYDIAQKFFQMLTLLNPDNIYDHLTLGSIFLQQDDYKTALEKFDSVLNLDGENKKALFLRFKALLFMQKNQQALDMASILINTEYRTKVIALCKTYHLPIF